MDEYFEKEQSKTAALMAAYIDEATEAHEEGFAKLADLTLGARLYLQSLDAPIPAWDVLVFELEAMLVKKGYCLGYVRGQTSYLGLRFVALWRVFLQD